MKNEMTEAFQKAYGDTEGVQVYFAPGRVNLIGEHTDYNGGHVFPCALSIGTYAAVRKRKDTKLRFYSVNFSDAGIYESDITDLTPRKESGWTNYPKGVMWAFKERDMKLAVGMDIVIYGNIPNGSGLSSSAALEVLTGFFLRDLYDFPISNIDIALLGQYAENHFCGMQCGIMDQFASAMGKKNHAIFLNTADLSYEYAPVQLENAKIIVTNSNVKHSLVDSKYNERRMQCEQALKQLQSVTDIKSLGELSSEMFEEYSGVIADETVRRRAKHAVYENQRTIQAVQALKENNIALFGELMNASHISLRDDYEVSCEEIDLLVSEAWKVDGVIGSRITGGGFGGCSVSIVLNSAIDIFQKKLRLAYQNKMGKKADFYLVMIGDGPRKIEE